MIVLEDVRKAAALLKPIIEKTPVIKSWSMSSSGQSIFLKLENLQRTGSFKIRGAYNKIASLTDEERRRGVIASSAGNHAQGVALSASLFKMPAVICMPATAPQAKIENTRAYGAEVVLNGSVYDDAYAKAVALQKERGYTFIHPFDDDKVIAGQGTIALELFESLDDIDAIIAPIGGGGLLSGIAVTAKALKPSVKIIGVQSASAASMVACLQNDKVAPISSAVTMADGIAVKCPGTRTFKILKEYMDDIVTVSEEEIAAAVFFLIEKHHIIAEGAGAVATAALLAHKIPKNLKRAVLMVSGGNIDISRISAILDDRISSEKICFNFSTGLSAEAT
jgi:threonine dehydratase